MGQAVSRSIILGFLILLSFDASSQVGLKLAGDRLARLDGIGDWLAGVVTEPLVALVLLCDLGAFFAYITLLKRAPVGPLYAAAHGHIVVVLLISYFFFAERLTLLQLLGCAAIVAGILILARTEAAAHPAPRQDGPGAADKAS